MYFGTAVACFDRCSSCRRTDPASFGRDFKQWLQFAQRDCDRPTSSADGGKQPANQAHGQREN
jgi:hypothetical protein